MAQLKDSILEANRAVDQERETNVSLLHLIFPPDIAKRLWLGKEGVTFIASFLFSFHRDATIDTFFKKFNFLGAPLKMINIPNRFKNYFLITNHRIYY